jgi:ATP phosphoribosyltransferase
MNPQATTAAPTAAQTTPASLDGPSNAGRPAAANSRAQEEARAARRLRLGLPKGRMQAGLFRLLSDAGLPVRETARGYRPSIQGSDEERGYEVKLLKPQNVVTMLLSGRRDLGFCGADWVAELGADSGDAPGGPLVELFDTGLDAVRLVAAAPAELLEDGALPARPLMVASEFQRMTRRWIEARGQGDSFVRSFGATEVFPPEDADLVCDLTQTGATLEANGLVVVDELLRSSTRLYARARLLEDASAARRVDELVLLLRSVLEARKRTIFECNVPRDRLDAVVEVLPGLGRATVAELAGGAGYAVKAAVPREVLPQLIPLVRARGGTDLLVSSIEQVLP